MLCVRCVIAVCPCAHFPSKKGSERRQNRSSLCRWSHLMLARCVLALKPHLTKLTVLKFHLQLIRDHPKTAKHLKSINSLFLARLSISHSLVFQFFAPIFRPRRSLPFHLYLSHASFSSLICLSTILSSTPLIFLRPSICSFSLSHCFSLYHCCPTVALTWTAMWHTSNWKVWHYLISSDRKINFSLPPFYAACINSQTNLLLKVQSSVSENEKDSVFPTHFSDSGHIGLDLCDWWPRRKFLLISG